MSFERRASIDTRTNIERRISKMEEIEASVGVITQNLAHEQGLERLDTDDFIGLLVDEIIDETLDVTEYASIVRLVPRLAARNITTQLFDIILTWNPSLNGSIKPYSLQVTYMEPIASFIDVYCRHEIGVKDPPHPPPPQPSTLPLKTKRLVRLTTMLISSMSPSPTSKPKSTTTSFRSKKGSRRASAPEHPDHSIPIPGVPYSTSPVEVPTTSPRKSSTLLKTHKVSVQSNAFVDSCEGEDEFERTQASCDSGEWRPPTTPSQPRRRFSDEATSDDKMLTPTRRRQRAFSVSNASRVPTPPTASSNLGWCNTTPNTDIASSLPNDTSQKDLGFVSIQYRVLKRELPNLESPMQPPNNKTKRSTIFPPAKDTETLEISPLDSLGMSIQTELTLAPGVKMHSSQGEIIKTGPQLPEFPTKMRRATFLAEQILPGGLTALQTMTDRRQSTFSDKNITAPSSQPPLSPSSSSKPGIFARSPSKIKRLCTVVSCTNSDGTHQCVNVNSKHDEARESSLVVAEITKQRALQHRPSISRRISMKKNSERRATEIIALE